MPNRQPVFTSTIILSVQTFNPVIAVDNYNAIALTPTLIHYGLFSGELIERITVTACGDLNNPDVSAKLV